MHLIVDGSSAIATLTGGVCVQGFLIITMVLEIMR